MARKRSRGIYGPAPTCCRRGRAFTLPEILLGVAIIAIMLSVSAFAFRSLAESSVLAQARNALVINAQVARSYAVTNRIETMLVVNPYNGRFEIWYLNPPRQGGAWDPLSSGDPTVPGDLPKTDGCLYAPVLDSGARLPLDGNDQPAALVCPVDYAGRTATGAPAEQEMDNLIWAALCFDEDGHVVIRTRRIATRIASRLADGTPNLLVVPLVDVNDTPITSAVGFVICDYSKLRSAIDVVNVTPQEFVDQWLTQTRPGAKYADHSLTVVLNRFSGDELVGGR